MKHANLFISKHKYILSIICILFLGLVLRFYGYDNRWGLAYDQAHDALIAREAIRQHKIPFTGPFSSAGPFVTGPEWYWFIALATLPYPTSVMTPWVVLTIVFILNIYILSEIGKEIGGVALGFITGILTAVSTAEISQSVNLTNQAPLSILSAVSVWCCVLYLKTGKRYFLFLLALFISLGVNTHLQGVLLIPLFLIVLLKKTDIKGYLSILIGFFIPCIPLGIVELQTHFYDTRHILAYYLHDQYKISLDQFGRRWSTYLGIFLPQSFSGIIGGYRVFGYVFFLVLPVSCIIVFTRKTFPKIIILLIVALSIAVIFMRYTRTPLFDSYLMFLHPWILISCGWAIYITIKKQKIVGLLMLILFLTGSMSVDIKEIVHASNITALHAKAFEQILRNKLPGKKFALFDNKYKTTGFSVPLSLYLSTDNLIQDNGEKIGISIATPSADTLYPRLIGDHPEMQMYILSSSNSAQLKTNDWYDINPSEIYRSTEEWYH